jgi:hypothetical protein
MHCEHLAAAAVWVPAQPVGVYTNDTSLEPSVHLHDESPKLGIKLPLRHGVYWTLHLPGYTSAPSKEGSAT